MGPVGKCRLVMARGTFEEFDRRSSEIPQKLINKHFCYQVLPYFFKGENNKQIGSLVSAKYHATGGPMTVERYKLSHDIFLFSNKFII